MDSSFSNKSEVNTAMAVIPSTINAEYGTVDNNQPSVRFSIDSASELDNYVLLRSDSPSGPYDSIASIKTKDKVIDYHDLISASEKPYYYRLKALNYCMQAVRISENTASTIYLQGQQNGTTVALNWTAYYNWLDGVSSYQLQRSLNNGNFEDIAIANGLNYIDNSLSGMIGNNIGNNVCYSIMAEEKAGNHNTSTSNIICFDLPLNIRFEFNAFQPGSASNSTFGPMIDFIPTSFSFKIYNRWGSKIFESGDPTNCRWNGFYDGIKVAEGVYRYQLEYKNENDKTVVLNGDVTVVY